MRNILKRRWFWATVLLAAVVGVAYLVIPVNETGVSKANFDRIRKGWTEQQVEELLGARASGRAVRARLPGTATDLWWGDEFDLIVVGIDEGVVTEKDFYTASDLTPLERVKRRVMKRLRALWP
jgi:hypothetical protein